MEYEFNPVLIFTVVWLAMIANSHWEAYVEGDKAWDKGKLGWKLRIGKYVLSAYHFYLFFVMWPMLLSLPLIIYGWNLELFGILLSAYISGLVVEDFFWFVVNPKIKLGDFNSNKVRYYPWVKLHFFEIPLGYVLGIISSVVIWLLIWRT